MALYTRDTIRLGAELPRLARQWNLEAFRERHELVYGEGLVVEEAWPERNIHADQEAAAREGLAEPVGSAPQLIALVHRAMLLAFGAGWLAGGAIDVRMIKPLLARDFTTLRGRVVGLALEPDGDGGERVRATCTTAVVRADGTPLLVGQASAALGP